MFCPRQNQDSLFCEEHSECDGVDDDRLLCSLAVFWIRDECIVDVCKLLNINVLHRKLTSSCGLHEGQQD